LRALLAVRFRGPQRMLAALGLHEVERLLLGHQLAESTLSAMAAIQHLAPPMLSPVSIWR